MNRTGQTLAWLALGFALASLVAAGALVGFKFGWLNWPVSQFLIYRAAEPLALVAVVSGVVAAVMTGIGRQRNGFILSLVAAAIGVLIYAAVANQIAVEHRFPPVHDVSTTWADPPMPTAALASRRGLDAQPVQTAPSVPSDAPIYAGKPIAEVNARTCPAAVPVTLTTAPANAYAAALKAVRERGLKIVTDDPARGVIEATSTNFWNMKDNLMIRVRAEGAGARVDIRSVSREASSDRGHNCRRVGQIRAALTPGG